MRKFVYYGAVSIMNKAFAILWVSPVVLRAEMRLHGGDGLNYFSDSGRNGSVGENLVRVGLCGIKCG